MREERQALLKVIKRNTELLQTSSRLTEERREFNEKIRTRQTEKVTSPFLFIVNQRKAKSVLFRYRTNCYRVFGNVWKTRRFRVFRNSWGHAHSSWRPSKKRSTSSTLAPKPEAPAAEGL